MSKEPSALNGWDIPEQLGSEEVEDVAEIFPSNID